MEIFYIQSFFCTQTHLNPLEKYEKAKQLSIIISCNFEVLYFVKMFPIFVGSFLFDFEKYDI